MRRNNKVRTGLRQDAVKKVSYCAAWTRRNKKPSICLYAFFGEPIERASFSFGGAATEHTGYIITDDCIGCGSCLDVCPQSCIDITDGRAAIRQENCLHCGNCEKVCPVGAVVRS